MMKKVLTILIMFLLPLIGTSQITYAYGSYTGTGGSGQSITGLAFQPEAVMVKSEGTHQAYIRIAGMDANESKPLGTGSTACVTNRITSLDATGFTVGTNAEVDASSTTYHWIAWDSSNDCYVGTYVGNGGWDDENVTGVGFQSESIIIMGDAASLDGDAAWDLQTLGWGSSEGFFTRDGSSDASTTMIASVNADGFNSGAGANSPWQSSTNYYYICFNESGNTLAQNTYNPGADSDGQTIAISGTSSFQPDFMMVYKLNLAPVFRIASQSGDATLSFDATAVESGLIESFVGTGITIGTDDRVSTASNNHHYFATSGGSLLPVELTFFNGAKAGEQVHLRWETAMEINSSHFILERSIDGIIFEDYAQVQAAGNSQQVTQYEYFDEFPSTGKNYYRLRQVDFDNTQETFRTVMVDMESGNSMVKVNVVPNPVVESANILFNVEPDDMGTYTVEIINQLGELVFTTEHSSTIGVNKVDLGSMYLPKGNYIAKLQTPNKQTSFMKFVKSR